MMRAIYMSSNSKRLSIRLIFSISLFVLGISSTTTSFAENITGKWYFDYGYYMEFTQSGNTFTGFGGEGSAYTWPVTNGIINGNQVSWHEQYNELPSYQVDRVGTINGNTITGTWTNTGGNAQNPFTATKVSSGSSGTPTPNPSGKRPTALNLFCNRGGVNLERASCSVTLADAGAPPRFAPTGVVDLVATNGFFPATASCFPQQTQYSPGILSCKVEFEVPNGFPIGAKFPIDAIYYGDSNFKGSSTSHTLIQAGCVGNQQNPCSGAVAMAFADVPAIVKNVLSTILECGGGPKAKSFSSMRELRSTSSGCGMTFGMDGRLSEMLDKLGFDQSLATKIAEELDKQNLGKDAMLKGLQDLFEEAGKNQQFFDKINSSPGALNKAIQEYIKKQQNAGNRISAQSRRAFFNRKNIIASLGSLATTVKSNNRKVVKVKLNTFGKKLITAFRKAGVGSVNIKLNLTSKRIGAVPKGVKKKVSVSQTVDVAL